MHTQIHVYSLHVVALRRHRCRHLVELWDDIRQKNEPGSWTAATRVQRSLLMGDFMVVALTNNRFCFKKGAAWSRFAKNGLG